MRLTQIAATMVLSVSSLHVPRALSQSERLDSKTDGAFEIGLNAANPTGPSDYFSVRFNGGSPTETVLGVHISVADFGTTASAFPTVGIYRGNLALDPTGRTPDLGNGILSGIGALNPGSPVFNNQLFNLGSAPNEADLHAVAQFPPGDPGFLAIGVDTDINVLGGGESPGQPNPRDSSALTTNGYSTPGVVFDSIGDFGLGVAIASGSQSLPALRLSSLDSSGGVSGDYTTLTTDVGKPLALSFWGVDRSPAATLWLLFISFAGVPVFPVGSPLPSAPVGDGSTSIRVASAWPPGAGNITLNFIAATGSPGIVGSVSLSNEVTLHALPNCSCGSFGFKDDGTYESGWVVQGVAGSSDYFSTPWGTAPGSLSSSSYSVMDFGTTFSAYPRSGQAPPNLAAGPAGNTPDLSNPYVDQPLSFPALTFVSTSGQLVGSTFGSYTPGTDVLEFIQFPPTDPALLGVGADTNAAFIDGLAGWTLDGYSTAANLFGLGNWGFRTQ